MQRTKQSLGEASSDHTPPDANRPSSTRTQRAAGHNPRNPSPPGLVAEDTLAPPAVTVQGTRSPVLLPDDTATNSVPVAAALVDTSTNSLREAAEDRATKSILTVVEADASNMPVPEATEDTWD